MTLPGSIPDGVVETYYYKNYVTGEERRTWQTLRILSVAVRRDDGEVHTLPAPARHHDVLHQLIRDDPTVANRETASEGQQGFLTNAGRFVTREEAWAIAERSGQLLDRAPTDGRGGTLYSEDVW